MGKEKKKGSKANVFKVAGAKSLKKTKAKAVNLGLKNIKQKVVEMDKEFLDQRSDQIRKSNPKNSTQNAKIQGPQKKETKNVTKEEVISTSEQIDKMDL